MSENNQDGIYKKILDSSPDGVVGINDKREIVIFNKQAEFLFGYKADELMGKFVERLMPPSGAKHHEKLILDFISNSSMKQMEHHANEMIGLKKDGKEFPINVRLSSVETPDGKIALASIRDITEIKSNEQKLQESITQFTELFESSVDEIYLVEPRSLRIVNVNNTACKSTGFNKNELINNQLTKVVPPMLLAKNAFRILNVLRGKEEVLRAMHKTKEGVLYPVEIKIKTIEYLGKKMILGIARNLTDRNRMEQELYNSQQHLVLVNENSPDTIITVDPLQKITYINRINTGVKESDVIDSDVLTFVPNEFKTQFKVHLKAAFSGQDQHFEMEGYGMNLELGWYSVRMSPLEKNSQSPSLLIIYTDITEQKIAKRRQNIISSISSKLNSNSNLDSYCQYVYLQLKKIKPFQNLYISRYNETKGEISVFFLSENGKIMNHFPKPRKAGRGLSEHIIRTKKGLLLNGKEMASFHEKHELKVYGTPAKSWVGVPLMNENKAIGVLAAQCFQDDHAFSQEDMNLLSFIGTQVGTFIEKSDAEKEIRQFEKYFSVSMDLLCIAGTDGFLKKINPKFFEVLGYTEKELFSKPFIEFVHPDDVGLTNKEVEKLSNGIPTISFTNRYLCKSGEYKWLLWSTTPDPESGWLYAAARDITVQKRSQDILTALSDVQNLFIADASVKEVFDNMLKVLLSATESEYGFIGEILHDKDNQPYLKTHAITNISWNKETSDFYKESAPKGLEFSNLKTLFGKVISTGKPVIADNHYNDPRREGLPDGHPFMSCFMGLPFYQNDELVGMVGIANKPGGYSNNDISTLEPFLATCSTLIKAHQNSMKKTLAEEEALKIKEEFTRELEIKVFNRTQELEETQKILGKSLEKEKELGKLKSRFVSTASHQFRTPLTVIQSNMGLLAMQRDYMDEQFKPKFEKVYGRIKIQIERMTNLMNEVLLLGKINEGNIKPVLIPIDLVMLCEEIGKNYNEIQEDGRKVNLRIKGKPRNVNLDARLMEHAISNLLSNAFKYSIGKPAPLFSIGFEENVVQISIQDYGMGVPKKDLDNLFEPFYRASNTNEVAGTGLGTSISKEYIEMNGGSINVISKLNTGTEFIVTF